MYKNKATQKRYERALARYTPPAGVLSALEALSHPYVRGTVLLPDIWLSRTDASECNLGYSGYHRLYSENMNVSR